MEEKDFKSLMKHSNVEIQFPDFEDKVMVRVMRKEATRKSVWRNLKLSWVFFIIGTFFGIFSTQFLADIQIPYFGENSKIILLIGEILIVLVIASQFDSLLRFTFKKRE